MEMSRRLTRIKEQVLVGSSLKASVFEQLLSKRLLVLKVWLFAVYFCSFLLLCRLFYSIAAASLQLDSFSSM